MAASGPEWGDFAASPRQSIAQSSPIGEIAQPDGPRQFDAERSFPHRRGAMTDIEESFCINKARWSEVVEIHARSAISPGVS